MPGFIVCLMCRAKLTYVRSEPSHYNNHLKYHHGVYFNHHLLLAVNLLNESYFQKLHEEFVSGRHQSDLTGAEGDDGLDDDGGPDQTTRTVSDKLSEGGIFDENSSEKVEKNEIKHELDKEEEALASPYSHQVKVVKTESDDRKRKTVQDEKTESSYKKSKIGVLNEAQNGGKREEIFNKDLKESNINSKVKFKSLMFSCDECNFSFDKNIKLRKHKEKHKITKGIYIKKEEIKVSDVEETSKILINDVKENEKPKRLTCDQCDFFADKNIKLKKHKEKHKNDSTNQSKALKVGRLRFSDPASKEKVADKSIGQSSPVSENENIGNSLLLESNKREETKNINLEKCPAKSYQDIRQTSDYFHQFPKQLRAGSACDKLKFSTAAPNFPAQWFVRASGKRPCDKEFLAPDFTIFRSRKAAIEYLKCMEFYSREEIERVENS